MLPLLYSCDERPVEYEVQSGQPRLVVNSLFEQDSLWRIEVSNTAGPGDDNKIVTLKHARVQLFENGVRLRDIQVDSSEARPWYVDDGQVVESKIFYHKTQTSRGRLGYNYEVRVTYPGYPDVSATSHIPGVQRLRHVTVRTSGDEVYDGRTMSPVRFAIDDDGADNYYAIEVVVQQDGDALPARTDFYSKDKVFGENLAYNPYSDGPYDGGEFYYTEAGVYFSNDKFRGKDREFLVYVDSKFLEPNASLKIRVLNLSADYFKFATTFQRARFNANIPFAEPTQVFSNVTDGLGIFAGYSVDELVIN